MAILTWRKRVANRERFFLPCGSPVKLTYMLNIDDNGCECLCCTGQTDLYAEIQSYRDGCDLAMLLRNIDPNALNSMVSSFSADDIVNSGIVDYATMPSTLGGMFNLVQKGENLFNGLPEEIRAEFNYSVKNFVSQFGTADFNAILSKYASPVAQTANTGVNVPDDKKQSSEPKNEPKNEPKTKKGDKE